MEEDLLLLRHSVFEAGKIALGYFGQSPETMTKNDGSPVSEADLAVDNYLKQQLISSRKSYGWLSEETEDNPERLNLENVWIVDPIDGTRAFIQQKQEWTISVALVCGAQPVLAMVYNPVTKELYEAVSGQGARLNGSIIKVSENNELRDCALIAPGKIRSRLQEEQGLALKPPKSVNSIAYRMCLVSCGRVDGLLAKAGSCDWDIAAADLIVREAGGYLTSFLGERLKFNQADVRHNNVLASNDNLHNKLLKMCKNVSF